jgi:Inovirus Gp2
MDENHELTRLSNTMRFIYRNSSSTIFGSQSAGRESTGLLSEIEDFIARILQNNDHPFLATLDRNGALAYSPNGGIISDFLRLPRRIEAALKLPTCFEYNGHLTAFMDCVRELDLHPKILSKQLLFSDFDEKFKNNTPRHHLAYQAFNELVLNLRMKCKSKAVRDKIHSRRSEALKLYADYCDYVDNLFEYRSRLAVIRVDFGFAQGHANREDIAGATRLIDKFQNNWRNNKLFNGQVGYIIKTEYGMDKGIHFHLVLFFDDEKDPRKHIYLGQKIGEYWQNKITNGIGTYWNVNNQISNFIKQGTCGIGRVHRNDGQTIRNLKNIVLAYLCKVDQFFRPRFGNIKLIRKGLPKPIRAIKLGRPVKVS